MRVLIIIGLLLLINPLFATNKYFKATSGNGWGTAANWYLDATWTTGAGSVPGTGDSAIFLSGAGNVTLASGNCYSFNALTYNGVISGSGTLNVYGNLLIGSSCTWTPTIQTMYMKASSGSWKIELGGKVLVNITIGAAGTFKLQSATTISGQLYQISGTFDFNGYDFTAGNIRIDGSSTRTLTMGGNNLTLTNNITNPAAYLLNAGTGANLTITHTGAIIMPCLSIRGGGKSYNRIIVNGVSKLGYSWVADFTVGDLIITPTGTYSQYVLLCSNITVTDTCKITGVSRENRVSIMGANTSLGIRTITAGTHIYDNCDFGYIQTDDAVNLSSTNCGNMGGNGNNLTFPSPITRYWVGGTGSWSSTGEWSTSSGGSSGASIPVPGDTAVFDANSLASDATITLDIPAYPEIDFTNLDQKVTFPYVVGACPAFPYNVNFSNKCNTLSAAWLHLVGNSTYSLAGINRNIYVDCPGKTATISDMSGTLAGIVMYGGKMSAGSNLSLQVLQTQTTPVVGTPEISLGAYTLTLTGTTSYPLYYAVTTTFTAGTSTVKFTGYPTGDSYIISASNLSFYNLEFAPSGTPTASYNLPAVAVTVTNDFTLQPKARIKINSSGGLTTSGTVSATGTSSQVIYIGSTSASAATWTRASGQICLDWCNISNITATGGASFYAGINSTNGGNNTGWNWTSCEMNNTPTPYTTIFY